MSRRIARCATSMLLLQSAVVVAWSIDKHKEEESLTPTKNFSDAPFRNPEHEKEVAEHEKEVAESGVTAQATCNWGTGHPVAHSCDAGCDSGRNSGCDSSCDGGCNHNCDGSCDNNCDSSCDLYGRFSCDSSCNNGCDDSCNNSCDSNCNHSCDDNPTSSCDDSCDSGCQVATNCELTPQDFADQIRGTIANGINSLTSALNGHYSTLKDLRDGSPDLARAACNVVWGIFCGISPLNCLWQEIILVLKEKCPSMFGSRYPHMAMSIGFTAGATDGFVQIGIEMGIAMDQKGKRMCYVGGCAGAGITVPPAPGGGFGMAVTLWKHKEDIPGGTRYSTLGGEVPGLAVSGDFAIFGEKADQVLPLSGNFDPSKFLDSVGIGITMGLSDPEPFGNFNLASGSCHTPMCVQTECDGRPASQCGCKGHPFHHP